MSIHRIFSDLAAANAGSVSGTDLNLDNLDISANSIGADTSGGALIPTSVTASGAITSSSSTAGVGYATGAGGAATQATSKSTTTTQTPGKVCGTITMSNAALLAATTVTFQFNNTSIAARDVILLTQATGAASPASYEVWVTSVAAGSCIIAVTNITVGSLSEALVLNYAIIKAVAA